MNEPQPAACSGAEGGRATSSEANDIEMTSAGRQQIKRSPQEWGRFSAGLTNEIKGSAEFALQRAIEKS